MKKLAIGLATAAVFASGVAFGQTAFDYATVDQVKALIKNYNELAALKALKAADIKSVNCTAQVDRGAAGPSRNRPTLTLLPTDAGWASLLSTLNSVVTTRMTAAKTQLEGMGVTNVP